MNRTSGGIMVLISMQRSGTNWFMDIMGRLNSVLCLREIFNQRGVFGIDVGGGVLRPRFAELLDKPDVSERDAELIAYFAQNPIGAIDLIKDTARSSGRDWIGFTIFNAQLPAQTVAEVLSRPDVYPVLLKRQHLARYVSLLKARDLKVWKGIETTDLLPELDLNEFWKEVRRAEDWFQTLITRNPPVELFYETDVQGGAEPCLSKLSAAIPGFPWQLGDPVPQAKTKRQDLSDDVFERFASGLETRRLLEDRGQLTAALSYPGGS
jgi:hypothetical protein